MSQIDAPAKRGRPTKTGKALKTPIAIRLPEAMRAEIEAIRAARLDEPDISGVIRELIAEALFARQAKDRKRG